ncbi:MAG: hypothetical protein ACI9P7_002653 [Candidatus Azotimanducaceae bacterium]|jgi:uncharacterized protein YyaL (SSP411 family)
MRTTLVDEEGNPKYTNRLIDESSPYLKQHAHNPVDWHPWGDEAFDLARASHKPVFLSIGYSTCHWCHVMEHESFDNEEIAGFLNEHFVSIKLDREQRPDLDEIYMTGVQILSGQGGWPMSNFITADAKPFFAGTYYPPAAFLELLQQISTVWHEKHEEVLAQAEKISENIERYTAAKSDVTAIEKNLIEVASAELLGRLDEAHGGFGTAPKFPNESQVLALLEDLDRRDDPAIMSAAVLTLDKMYQGGIFDQVGGGFHRYTVDAIWLVPHFEKMLYNQAQLIRVYAKAYQLTSNPGYRRVIDRTISYVLRDMTGRDGRFYSATDADSEGEEGKFFVWRADELKALLGHDYDLVEPLYGVTESGNFEGANIFNLEDSLENFAAQQKLSIETLTLQLDNIHEQLYQARELRQHPLRDEKHITAWNGMMISALVQVEILTGNGQFCLQALSAAESLWQKHFAEVDSVLWRVGMQDEVSIAGNLEDYAYFAEACFQLYIVTADAQWKARGMTLLELMLDRFWDEQEGGFFFTEVGSEGPMITRPKSPMDGAMPSGNSVALMAMVLAYEASGSAQIEAKINALVSGFSGLLMTSPSAFSFMLTGLNRFLNGSTDPVQWAADGNLRICTKRQGSTAIVRFELADDWHINGSGSTNSDLIPTNISGGGAVEFPATAEVAAAFSAAPLQVFEGQFEIIVAEPSSLLEVTFQACNDSVCLKPQTIILRLGG